ncbi:MAG: hypothetical protein ISQ74_04450 [Puniceicoccaceae bacterium]|nr:hypothetical protein [Puniceicoccaceae bacterium]
MKKLSLLVFSLICAVSLQAATGIFGAYVTIGGTKYKSSASYAGAEATLGASSLGSFDVDTDSLIFSQAETLTYQNGGHSTFAFATAYRVRLASDSKSTVASAYSFISMIDDIDLGNGDEKGEFTGGTIDFLSGIAAPAVATDYAVDIIHKVGAWEGGENFERLANLNETSPGSTDWANTNAFTANFTVVPEPNTYALIAGMFGLAYIALKRRQA